MFAFCIALSAHGQARELPDLKGRTIKAVTCNDSVPLNFLDPGTGKAAGWEYDCVNEIARRLNARVAWSTAAWDAAFTAVRNGELDVGMDGFTITDGRRKQVAFSDTYMTSRQVMLARCDETRFTGSADFAADPRLLIGSQAGSSSFDAAACNVLDGDPASPRIKVFKTVGAAVKALIARDVDCVITDEATGKGCLGANPEKLRIIDGVIASEDYGFIFTLKSDLVAPFNAALKAMKADGTLDRLTTAWFVDYAAR
jgi:polar amino acid transport system substrate-binding protein